MNRKNRKKSATLHWLGFIVSAIVIILATAYGFSLSLRPNSFSLDSAPEEPLALVGVALANNIGTDIPRANSLPANLAQDVGGVQSAIMRDGFGGESFFAEHFQRLSELSEVLGIDVVSYLRVHPDRRTALENYIQQLTDKKGEAKVAATTLTQLRDFHSNALKGNQDEIKTAQASIEQSYAQKNGEDIIQSLAHLEELHIEEQEHKNITIFAQRFILEYNTLIATSEKKITVLSANTAALIQ